MFEHIEWRKHGRKFREVVDGIPTGRYKFSTHIGEKNTEDDQGGFIPFLLSAGKLKHGDCELEFATDRQIIKYLGNTICSSFKLYVQAKIKGQWVNQPHGAPTRTYHDGEIYRDGGLVTDDSKGTGVLSFPSAHVSFGEQAPYDLNVALEAGGSDGARMGIRFRGPASGNIRFQVVLDGLEKLSTDWELIKDGYLEKDPREERIVGIRVRNFRWQWTYEEALYRSVAVEDNPDNTKKIVITLGSFAYTKGEWLTIYPDTWVGGEIADANDDRMGSGYAGYGDRLVIDDSEANDQWGYGGLRWEGVDLDGATSIDSGTKLTVDADDLNAGTEGTIRWVAEDAQDPVDFSVTDVEDRTILTAAGDYVDHNFPAAARADEEYSMVNPIQALIDEGYTYDGTAGNDTLVLINGAGHAFGLTNVAYRTTTYTFNHPTGQPARLDIVYSVGGSIIPQATHHYRANSR